VEASWGDVYGPNILGTYNAFEAARRTGCARVIFASSNHAVGMYEVDAAPDIYEPKSGILVRPDAPVRPDSLYGVWKVFGEALGRYYSDAFGLMVACLRIGSITAHDDPRHPSVAQSSGWLNLTEAERFKRYAATWMSQADFARLVRAGCSRATCASASSMASATTRRDSGIWKRDARYTASGRRTA
jgi:nucleoside-diphosphate-sugar epimerase